MEAMKGKTLFVVNLLNSNGDYWGDKIKDTLIEGKYNGVALKVCHGKYWNGGHSKADRDRFKSEIRGLVHFYGWHWNEGYDPAGEALIACQAIDELGLEAYMMDYEAPLKINLAAQKIIMQEFRQRKPNFPVGLCSYRYPSAHPQIKWADILPFFDFHAPQVYWQDSHNPAFQLQKSYDELMALKNMPFIPVGAAYSEGGWQPTKDEITEFDDKCKSLKLQGNQWFSYRGAKALGYLPRLAGLSWPIDVPEPIEPPPPVNCEAAIALAVAEVSLRYETQIENLKIVHAADLAEAIITANNTALENLIKPYLL